MGIGEILVGAALGLLIQYWLIRSAVKGAVRAVAKDVMAQLADQGIVDPPAPEWLARSVSRTDAMARLQRSENRQRLSDRERTLLEDRYGPEQ